MINKGDKLKMNQKNGYIPNDNITDALPTIFPTDRSGERMKKKRLSNQSTCEIIECPYMGEQCLQEGQCFKCERLDTALQIKDNHIKNLTNKLQGMDNAIGVIGEISKMWRNEVKNIWEDRQFSP